MSTPTAISNHSPRWAQRSFGAYAIKILAFAIPVVASILWTIVLGRILPEPSGFVGHFIWWTIIAGGAIVVAMLVERAARRMLPMAMLLRLALVFPEAAPSRFSMALRANSTRQLKRRISEGIVDETATPQEAATALLELSAALSVHDRMTRGHAERVRAYAVMIGEQLDLRDDELNKLQWAALLHDVGKLDVDATILNKPGAPNDEELKSLRQHPERGREYMGALGPWLGEWALAAWEHHERFDGTGYPAQLDGDEISLAARIVSVADSYDVMTSTRSYKTAMDPQTARAELLACSGTQFDPEIVRAFLSVPISELRRPFQAALGAGALASLAQVAEIRTIATSAAAVGAAIVATTVSGAEPPPAIAFADETPVAVEIIEDSPLEIPLRTTIAADTYTLDSVDGPATATIVEDTLLIEPAPEESGTVTVVLTACSGDTCDTTAIVAEVVAVNDAPFASADSATTDALQDSISIPVLANDTDVDSGELSIESSQVTIGDGAVEVSADRQELLFTPEQGSIGPWTIEYVVTDGGNGFDRGTVTILDGDLAPEANDDVATVVVGESINIDARANDRDDGGVDRLVIIDTRVLGAASSQAQVSVDPTTGTLLFVPGPNPGVVTVEYTIQDRMLRESTAQILVEVTPVVPVAEDDSATIEQDTSATVDVLANDGPASLDLATATVRIVSNSEGTVQVASGEISYTPPPNAVGEAAVVYEVCSGPETCDTATLRITVTEVQSSQAFRADGRLDVPADGGPQLIPWAVVSAGRDAIAPGTTFSIRTDSPGLFITPPAISSTGSVTFEPRPTASGVARTTVTVTDGAGTREYRLSLSIS